MSFWSQDRERLLVALRRDHGLTSGQIAGRLGCTRNAVIGKLHRLGMTVPAQRSYPRSVHKKPLLQFAKPGNESDGRIKPPKWIRETIAGTVARCTLEDLEAFDRKCRYPHGDAAPYTFCGGTAVPGSSYCLAHLQACYTQPPKAAAAFVESQVGEVFAGADKNPAEASA